MLTQVYLIRHAESDQEIKDAKTRPLTKKGERDAEALACLFGDIPVSRIFSSPYLRAVQTVTPLSRAKAIPVQTDARMREWMGGRPFPKEKFDLRMQRLFADENAVYDGAESLRALKKRTGEFILHVLSRCQGETVVVGTHALALTAACSGYDDIAGYEFLMRLLPVAPFAACMVFDRFECVSVRYMNPLETEKLL